ncbi:hypothetical protein EDF54_0105 [Rathayibacter sp. PhB93]|uniref:hypothetical protein n=1 Tax=unclassified Rathayibacter TaxID=2609250 RepID=UPI000FBDD359|nr:MULTISPECIES: hypothetical protein [unclassified Rathayibacter]ROQ16983.1 hypothetical protein EDF54_0105 [Rathayibacter sp. PhB93]TDQ06801.1 hypothetical protein EDF17_3795 [Rathayibacter sp. PhB1]
MVDEIKRQTSESSKVGRVVTAVAGKFTAADALGALTQLVEASREAVQIHEVESTKREKLKTYRETEVARIEASERVLKDYFDRVFEERRETHRQLFAGLGIALRSGDGEALKIVVGGIVEVARTSPLADLGNLAELRAAWDDPDTVFEF